MSAIRLLQAERKEEIQHLHRQFMSGGILQRELWEEAELLLEIRESQVSDEALKGNIKRFLIRQGIHHIKEIDYTVRSRYEAELKKMWDEASVMRYLKVFDHIKQYSIQK